ncbi:MAG: HIT family protein [Acidimicrobiales bacterium]
MTSVFTRIIEGELPGRFLWRDQHCVAFLSINPIRAGHTLVVPRAEVDHWIDLDPATVAHLSMVAAHIGAAQQTLFEPARVGLMIAGFEVAHTHLHVIPIDSMGDLDFANAATDVHPAALDQVADQLRAELIRRGHHEAAA